jgi:allophanate hydrolase subunit 2
MIVNESLLEITLMGPTLLFNNNYTLTITGGDFNPTINDKKIELYKPIDVKLGDILKINQTSNAARCYLAFSGGIASEKYLGSKSSSKNITSTYFLKKGDEIKVSNNNKLNFVVNHKLKLTTSSFLNVFSGPEFSILKKDSLHNLFNKEFTIGINNRMAYNLTEQIQT